MGAQGGEALWWIFITVVYIGSMWYLPFTLESHTELNADLYLSAGDPVRFLYSGIRAVLSFPVLIYAAVV